MPEEQDKTRNDKGQFLPGVSGNPGGRPEGSVSIMAIIRRKLTDNPERAEQIADEILDDPKMRTEIIRQLDGAPKESATVSHTFPTPIADVSQNPSLQENSEPTEEN